MLRVILPSEVQTYLSHAKHFAKDLTDPEVQYSSPTAYAPHYHTPGYFHYHRPQSSLWNYFFPIQHQHTVHHYHHTESSNNKNKKENREALLAAISLLLASGALLYSSAAEWGRLSSIQADVNKFYREKKIVELDLNYHSNPMTAHLVQDIMDQHCDILKDCRNSSTQYLLAKGITTSGLALGVASCMKAWWKGESVITTAPALAVAALSLTIVGSLAWVVKTGFDSTAEHIKHKAMDLLEAINHLEFQAADNSKRY